MTERTELVVQYAENVVRREALLIEMQHLRDRIGANLDEVCPGWRDEPLPWDRTRRRGPDPEDPGESSPDRYA